MKIDVFAPILPASSPKRNANGIPTNCTSRIAVISALWSMPDLGAVAGGHPDDGVDAVAVDDERDEQQKGVLVSPQVAKGLREPAKRRRDHLERRSDRGRSRDPWFWYPTEKRDREQQPTRRQR